MRLVENIQTSKYGEMNLRIIKGKSNEDNLSSCLMNLKNSSASTGFKPMTSSMPVQCSNQLSHEVTQLRAAQFVGFMFSRERNVVGRIVIYGVRCFQ